MKKFVTDLVNGKKLCKLLWHIAPIRALVLPDFREEPASEGKFTLYPKRCAHIDIKTAVAFRPDGTLKFHLII